MNPNENPEIKNTGGLMGVASQLIDTLWQEQATLDRLHDLFGQQIEAVRKHRHGALEASTGEVNESVHAMERLRLARERQTRLLGRLLGLESDAVTLEAVADALEAMPDGSGAAQEIRKMRTQIHERARHTQKRCEDFEFTLKYAVELGREMLRVMQDFDVPPPARIYTSSGDSTQTAKTRTLVNKVG